MDVTEVDKATITQRAVLRSRITVGGLLQGGYQLPSDEKIIADAVQAMINVAREEGIPSPQIQEFLAKKAGMLSETTLLRNSGFDSKFGAMRSGYLLYERSLASLYEVTQAELADYGIGKDELSHYVGVEVMVKRREFGLTRHEESTQEH